MEAVQLFLNINKHGLNNEWNAKIGSSLKVYCATEIVEVIEQNESSNAQINISYDVDKVSLDEIELLLKNSGTAITDINIHFPSGITGIADPYGASAVSITIDEKLKKIDGVLSSAISSSGELKVVLDTTSNNKQIAIDEIVKTIKLLRFGNA